MRVLRHDVRVDVDGVAVCADVLYRHLVPEQRVAVVHEGAVHQAHQRGDNHVLAAALDLQVQRDERTALGARLLRRTVDFGHRRGVRQLMLGGHRADAERVLAPLVGLVSQEVALQAGGVALVVAEVEGAKDTGVLAQAAVAVAGFALREERRRAHFFVEPVEVGALLAACGR